MSFQCFILNLFRHGRKCRASTAYFVLVGKKTNSVLTYAACYHLFSYYHLLPHLKKEDYWQVIDQLVKEGKVVYTDPWIQLTEKGREELEKTPVLLKGCFGKYDQWLFSLQRRWLFIQQILSEYSYKNQRYLPLTKNYTEKKEVKKVIQQWKKPVQKVIENYVVIMETVLDILSPLEQKIFVSQWIGHQFYGFSDEELKAEYQLDDFSLFLLKTQLWIQLATFYEQSKELQSILQLPLPTLSPRLQWMQKAVHHPLSLVEMEKYLRKKKGTIFDYIVEVALVDSTFPYRYWITEEEEEKLMSYYQKNTNIGSWNYQVVQEEIGEISFYSYRLFQIKKGFYG